MRRKAARIVLFFGLVALMFTVIGALTGWDMVSISTQDGWGDLSGLDLSGEIARVRPEGFAFYPDAHLFPEDFRAGAPEGRSFQSADQYTVQYGTYRVTLRLPAGQPYALRSMAINFAQRIFIDGQEQAPVGWPGRSPDEIVPAARTAIYLFTPQTDETEIIFQYANYVYRKGGTAYPLYISAPDNLIRMELRALLRACVIVGCLVMIFVFYLGMYLFFSRRSFFLAFGASCLGNAIHMLLVGDKFMTRLWPRMDWVFSMRVEYGALIVMIASFVVYLNGMFPGLLNARGFRLYMGLNALFALAVLATKPAVFSWGLLIYQAVSVPYGVYIIWRLARNLRVIRDTEAILVIAGGGVFILGILAESYLYIWASHPALSGLEQSTMMVFVFANMLALAVRYARTEDMLAHEQALSRMKDAFWAQAAHDLKTPVTAMGLAIQRLETIRDDAQRRRFTTALGRSQREIAHLVSNLLDTSRLDGQGMRCALQALPADELCVTLQAKYEGILEIEGVYLDVSADTGDALLADKALLNSVLDNLIYNALRYTPREGTIQVAIERAAESVRLTISDTGPGIPADSLPKLFERGFTAGDKGGSGMGLYIVKTAMERMGGSVQAGNRPEGGAVFTLLFQAQASEAMRPDTFVS